MANWCDPKQSRNGTSQSVGKRLSRAALLFAKLLIWVLIVSFLYGAFRTFVVKPNSGRLRADQKMTAPQAAITSAPPKPCDNTMMPANGFFRVDNPSILKRSDVTYSGLRFENLHSAPLTATISTPGQGASIATILIHAGKTAELGVPIGQYGLQVAMGPSWCGDTFANARTLWVSNEIIARPGDTTKIAISTANNSAAVGLNFSIGYTQQRGQSMILAADRFGHYRIDGLINGRPIKFLLDTGASVTTISRRFANELGIHRCESVGRSQTANGLIETCGVRVGSLEFGPFSFKGIEVNILENIEGDALLGMNILRSFSLQQLNGQMWLNPA